MALFVSSAVAQEAGPATVPQAPAAFEMPMMLVIMAGIFYFLLIRPQQKNARIHREMVGGVKRGDRVVTGGGIFGTVIKADESDSLQVEIAPGVTVEVARTTLISVLPQEAAVKPAVRQPKARKLAAVDTASSKVANDN